MNNKKKKELTIDDYLKTLGARWHKEPAKRGLILSQEGIGHFSVRIVDIAKTSQNEDSDDEMPSQVAARA